MFLHLFVVILFTEVGVPSGGVSSRGFAVKMGAVNGGVHERGCHERTPSGQQAGDTHPTGMFYCSKDVTSKQTQMYR